MTDYNYRDCQSLFGYAEDIHARSGGICQLCGAGAKGIDFDLWRQLTVEHLIGQSQGGYNREIRAALVARFPQLEAQSIAQLAARIDSANTITACSFCNSTTSRDRAPISMTEAIETSPDGSLDEIYSHVITDLDQVLERKRQNVTRKLKAVREAFDLLVYPRLKEARPLALLPHDPT